MVGGALNHLVLTIPETTACQKKSKSIAHGVRKGTIDTDNVWHQLVRS